MVMNVQRQGRDPDGRGAGRVVLYVALCSLSALAFAAGPPEIGGLSVEWWALVVAATALAVAGIAYVTGRGVARAPYAFLYTRANGAWVKYPIARDVAAIGRHPDNAVAIYDRSLSRFHAEIVRHPDGRCTISDLGSKNGLRVRFHPVRTSPLSDGDLVELGHVRFRFALVPVDDRILEDTQTMEAHRLWPERERRHHTRYAAHARALLYDGNSNCIETEVKDVSDKGMLLQGDCAELAPKTPVKVAVELEKGHWHTLQGVVARQTDERVGIEITETETSKLESLHRLRDESGAPPPLTADNPPATQTANVVPLKRAG